MQAPPLPPLAPTPPGPGPVACTGRGGPPARAPRRAGRRHVSDETRTAAHSCTDRRAPHTQHSDGCRHLSDGTRAAARSAARLHARDARNPTDIQCCIQWGMPAMHARSRAHRPAHPAAHPDALALSGVTRSRMPAPETDGTPGRPGIGHTRPAGYRIPGRRPLEPDPPPLWSRGPPCVSAAGTRAPRAPPRRAAKAH